MVCRLSWARGLRVKARVVGDILTEIKSTFERNVLGTTNFIIYSDLYESYKKSMYTTTKKNIGDVGLTKVKNFHTNQPKPWFHNIKLP